MFGTWLNKIVENLVKDKDFTVEEDNIDITNTKYPNNLMNPFYHPNNDD